MPEALPRAKAKREGHTRKEKAKPTLTIFLENVVTYPKSCWEWKGKKDRNGYSLINVYNPDKQTNTTRVAHRWIWEEWYGPVPEGLELDHICDNRGCVRPSHLEPVTHQENCQRAWLWRKYAGIKRKPVYYEPRYCEIEGCGKKHRSKGLCNAHYHKKRYHEKKEN